MYLYEATVYYPGHGAVYTVPIQADDLYTAQSIASAQYGSSLQYVQLRG